MKRYTIDRADSGAATEDAAGDWVRYEDVLREHNRRVVDELESLVLALSNRNGLSDDQAEMVDEIRRRMSRQ